MAPISKRNGVVRDLCVGCAHPRHRHSTSEQAYRHVPRSSAQTATSSALSQRRAAEARSSGRCETLPVRIPCARTWGPRVRDRRGSMRPRSASDVGRVSADWCTIVEGGIHAAGPASPICDEAAAMPWTDSDAPAERGISHAPGLCTTPWVATRPRTTSMGGALAEKYVASTKLTIADSRSSSAAGLHTGRVVVPTSSPRVPWEKLNVNEPAIAAAIRSMPPGALAATALHGLEGPRRRSAPGDDVPRRGLGIATVIQRI